MFSKIANGHLNTAICIALASIGGTASAQSSVNIWGIMDAGVQHVSGGGNGSATGIASGGFQTSRLGFYGKEDLGSGLSANFNLEGRLNIDTGTGGSTNTNNQASGVVNTGGLMFDRFATVNLESHDLGKLQLGHDFVPTMWNNVAFDPFHATGLGSIQHFNAAPIGSGSLYTNQTASNTVSYWLPVNRFGIYAEAMTGFGENNSTAVNKNDGRLYGGRIGYKAGPLDFALATTKTKYNTTATIGDLSVTSLGGSYVTPYATVFGLYTVSTVDLLAGKADKRTAMVGAEVPVGATSMIRFSYAQLSDESDSGLKNTNGSNRDANDAKHLAVGYIYNFSKRTAFYANAVKIRNSGQATYTIASSVSPLAGRVSSGFDVGLRHRF